MQMLVLECWRAIILNRGRFSQHEKLPKLYSKSPMNRNHEKIAIVIYRQSNHLNYFNVRLKPKVFYITFFWRGERNQCHCVCMC